MKEQMKRIFTFKATLLAALLVIGGTVYATTTAKLLRSYAAELGMSSAQLGSLLAQKQGNDGYSTHAPWSLGAPIGFASAWGSAVIGMGVLTPDPAYGKTTVPLVAGMGFGNPFTSLGGSIRVASIVANPAKGKNSFESGFAGINVGHTWGNTWGPIGVQVGAENVLAWGFSRTVHPAFYAAASFYKEISTAHSLDLVGTVGIGNRRFGGVFKNNNRDHVSGFTAWALTWRKASAIVDYTSHVLTMGAGVLLSHRVPIVITVGAFDLNHHLPRRKTSLLVSVAYSLHFA